MGWTSFHFTGTKAEFLQQEFGNDPSWGTIVDFAIKGNVIYAAVKMGSKHAEREGKIFAMIILISIRKNQYNFSYKDMSESCGPCESNCPKRIISLLSPLEELYSVDSNSYQWAKEWRERCATEKPKTVKVIEGNVIKLETPVKTSYGGLYQYFKKTARTNVWVPLIDRSGTLEPANNLIRFRASRYQFSIVG